MNVSLEQVHRLCHGGSGCPPASLFLSSAFDRGGWGSFPFYPKIRATTTLFPPTLDGWACDPAAIPADGPIASDISFKA